jgi:hypothetical protein
VFPTSRGSFLSADTTPVPLAIAPVKGNQNYPSALVSTIKATLYVFCVHLSSTEIEILANGVENIDTP